ncbi:MAG: acylphosphatase [Elusimicrobia bacterium]|nr:acylphosphatase [Elusimicrobiota bacterium]
MAEPAPLTRRHLLVTGRVQGVGYRWFARELAESLGVTGWVRNREDGSVEAEAEGTPEALDEFVARLKDGNPSARVAAVAEAPRAPEGSRGFEIRR